MFGFVIFWVLFSVLIGYFAEEKKGRSGGWWFLTALIFSPLVALIFLIMSSNKGAKKCPKCAENVKKEAVKCKHCGHDFPTEQDKQ